MSKTQKWWFRTASHELQAYSIKIVGITESSDRVYFTCHLVIALGGAVVQWRNFIFD